MQTNWLGVSILLTAGVAMVALAKTQEKKNRLVLTFKLNEDGTCTYTYDDGSQETGGCLEPPS